MYIHKQYPLVDNFLNSHHLSARQCIKIVRIIEGLRAYPTQVDFRAFFLFLSKSAEFLHVAFDSIQEHCPVFFFANFCLFSKKNRMQKTRRPSLHTFVKIENKRNRLSSLFRIINGAGH